jgi:hypothetical protein
MQLTQCGSSRCLPFVRHPPRQAENDLRAGAKDVVSGGTLVVYSIISVIRNKPANRFAKALFLFFVASGFAFCVPLCIAPTHRKQAVVDYQLPIAAEPPVNSPWSPQVVRE